MTFKRILLKNIIKYPHENDTRMPSISSCNNKHKSLELPAKTMQTTYVTLSISFNGEPLLEAPTS